MSRQQFKNVRNLSTNFKIVKSRDTIWNNHEKCIQISTNMPGIGSLIREIHVKVTGILESKTDFRSVKPMPAFKVLKLWSSFFFCQFYKMLLKKLCLVLDATINLMMYAVSIIFFKSYPECWEAKRLSIVSEILTKCSRHLFSLDAVFIYFLFRGLWLYTFFNEHNYLYYERYSEIKDVKYVCMYVCMHFIVFVSIYLLIIGYSS